VWRGDVVRARHIYSLDQNGGDGGPNGAIEQLRRDLRCFRPRSALKSAQEGPPWAHFVSWAADGREFQLVAADLTQHGAFAPSRAGELADRNSLRPVVSRGPGARESKNGHVRAGACRARWLSEIHDAHQLMHIGQSPVVVSQIGHVLRERAGVKPTQGIVFMNDFAISVHIDERFGPHEPRAVVGNRSVPVVRESARERATELVEPILAASLRNPAVNETGGAEALRLTGGDEGLCRRRVRALDLRRIVHERGQVETMLLDPEG
jgi:hypothetical protein